MRKVTLYTGGGISLSPQNGEGRRLSACVRLIAHEDMGITDGETVVTCVDTMTPEKWTDCPLPEMEEPYESA